MTEIAYSRGSNTYDANPEQRTAQGFAAFCEAIMADRGSAKGQQYVCAAMSNGHRSKASALPRRWIGLDLDGCAPDDFAAMLRTLEGYSALVYTTASSTPEQPRARIVVELAAPADRDAARATSRALRDRLGASLAWDASCDRAEQPLFLPLHSAQTWRFTGRPMIPVPGVGTPVVSLPDVIPDAHPVACRLAELDLSNAADDLRRALPGNRNNLLAAVAHRIGGMLAAGRLSHDVATGALMDATDAWDEPDKSRATILRQLSEGGRSPLVLMVPDVDRSAIPARRSAFDDGPRIRNGADLMQRHFEPTTWIVDGILPAGVSLLSGDPKVGKSFLSLQFAFAVATGCALWDGRKPEARGRSLYLALEDNDKRMQRRISGVKLDRGQPGADMSCFDYATDWPRGAEGVDEMRTYLHANPDCRLVIIDTIAAWRDEDPGRKSAYQHDYQVGQLLKPLGREFDIAILLVTHNRKQSSDDAMQKISGTQGLLGSVDGALILEKAPRGAEHSTLVVNGRDIEDPSELAITRTATGFWSCLGKADEVARSAESQAVTAALVSIGGIGSARQIQEAMGEAVRIGTLRMRLSRMVKRGEIMRSAMDDYCLPSSVPKELPEPPEISAPIPPSGVV